jgi:hypothetical protein
MDFNEVVADSQRKAALVVLNTENAKIIRKLIIEHFGQEFYHTLRATAKTDIHKLDSFAEWTNKHLT